MDRTDGVTISGFATDRDRSIHVLHVDDDPELRELTREFLRRTSDRFTVSTARTGADGLERLADGDVDCVVSDFDMPGMDGLEFLEAVREDHDELPFLLFTGKGSEEIASEAISAGVTDYLRKRSGSDQYDLLANRIVNAVDQYRSQREIRTAHDWFENLLNHSSDYVFVLNEDGRFEYVSPTVERNLGYDPGDVVGDVAFEYVHPDHRERVLAVFAELIDEPGREETLEARIERADGTWGWLEVRGRSIEEEQLMGCVVVNAREVTDRKERERERDRQADLFERTQRLAKVGGWEIDLAADEYRWTDGVRWILGLDADYDPELQDALDRFHPDDRAALQDAIQRAIEDGESHDGDHRIETEAGEYRWVHVKGSPQREDGETVRIRGVVQDVHEERQYERRIRVLHETTRRLIMAESPAEIAGIATEAAKEVIDLEINGLFLYDEAADALETESLTAEAASLFGADVVLPIEESLAGRVFHTKEPLVFEDVRSEAEAHNEASEAASEMIFPLGDHGVFMASKTIVGGFDERIVGLAGVLAANVEAALDRTDKHRRLAEREQQLAVQNERLDEFTGIVSHDLRNPLNVATGRLELAREECDSDHLLAVKRSLSRMEELIDELRALSKAGNVMTEPTAVTLRDVAERAWDHVDTAEGALAVESDRTIEADESRFQQLFENLFRNAIEHGGRDVTVTVGDHGDGFFVADDGRGITVEERERVFESGYSAKDGGTGLGLQIVAQIAAVHGWAVDVTASEPGGARFEFSSAD